MLHEDFIMKKLLPRRTKPFFCGLIIVLLAFASVAELEGVKGWAANVYIDPSARYNGDGTAGTQATSTGAKGAYNSWSKASFSKSNDYYQKCGTTQTMSSTLEIKDVDGTTSNKVIFGAYYLEGSTAKIGVSGKKPIIARSGTSGAVLIIDGSDHVTIRNLDLQKGATVMYIKGSNYFIIENCNLGKGTSQYGIRVFGEDRRTCGYGIIRNNTLDTHMQTYHQEVGSGALNDAIVFYLTGHHCKIYNNIIKDWGHSGILIYSTSKGDRYSGGVSNNEIYDNVMDGTNSPLMRGLDLSSKLEGYCQYNKVYRNKILNMTKHNNIGGTHNEYFLNITDTVLHTRWMGNGFSVVGYAGPVKYNKIYNNVIFNTEYRGIQIYNQPDYDIIKGNEFVNNILSHTTSYPIYINESNRILDNVFKNNVLYKKNAAEVTVYYRGTALSASGFNKKNGNNGDTISGNITADCMLRDPQNGDYSLRKGSLCIDAGTDVGLSSDFIGNPIPQGKPDIGAFETGSIQNPKKLDVSDIKD